MPDLIKVMISSRCEDPIRLHGETKKYTDLRREIKEAVEAEELFGEQLFEVWINEEGLPQPGSKNATEGCLQKVDKADILIALYNGDAGWAETKEDNGICHEELARALSTEPAKARLIQVKTGATKRKPDPDGAARNQRFAEYIERTRLFRNSPKAKNGDEAKELFLKTLHEAVIAMAQQAKQQSKEGVYYLGAALDWSLLDFSGRKNAMEGVIHDYLEARAYIVSRCPDCGLFIRMTGSIREEEVKEHKVLALFHAIPSAMSVAAAREMVGRPFYRDYEYSDYLTNENGNLIAIGPIHFIGCHKNVTDTQVRNLVGHPDIILITAPFGVYMADTVQHTQIIFLAGCCDGTYTRNALGRFFEWLNRSGKSSMLVTSAESRAKIVSVIAKEFKRIKEISSSTETRSG